MKKIFLSFDVEEFDLPLEYSNPISEDEQYNLSYKGLNKILKLLDKLKISVTFFVTYSFAKKFPKLIKNISVNHEIGLHGYEHKDNYSKWTDSEFLNKIGKAKKGIEKIISKKILGFRAPRLQKINYKLLHKLDFKYDSSFNPTFIPGRYNNLLKKRRIFIKENIKVIPASVWWIIKYPIYPFYLRIFGSFLFSLFSTFGILGINFLNMYFHTWDFVDLSKFRINFIYKHNSGEKFVKTITRFLQSRKSKICRLDNVIKTR